MTIPVEQAAINLAVALGLSAVIGFERQWRNRLAGLRTNTLVALGAATFVIFSALVPGDGSPTPRRRTGRVGDRIPRCRTDLPRRVERARAQYGAARWWRAPLTGRQKRRPAQFKTISGAQILKLSFKDMSTRKEQSSGGPGLFNRGLFTQ